MGWGRDVTLTGSRVMAAIVHVAESILQQACGSFVVITLVVYGGMHVLRTGRTAGGVKE